MTKEKKQLDNIIRLFNSNQQTNIDNAIIMAESFFGITKSELDILSASRGNGVLEKFFSDSLVYRFDAQMNTHPLTLIPNFSIKMECDLDTYRLLSDCLRSNPSNECHVDPPY